MQLFLIVAILIALLAVFFAIQNTAMVTVYFFVWQFSSSLALVLLFSLAIGVILSLLFSLPALQSRNWQISKLKKKLNEFNEENDNIRNKIAEQLGQINSLQRQVNEYREKLLHAPKVTVGSDFEAPAVDTSEPELDEQPGFEEHPE